MILIAIILCLSSIIIKLAVDHRSQDQETSRLKQQLHHITQEFDQTTVLHELRNRLESPLQLFNQYYNELGRNHDDIQDHILSYNKQIQDINKKLTSVYQYHFDQIHSDLNLADAYNIVLLGQTGYAKSTLGNRLCGDHSEYGNTTCFTTSTGADGCTQFTEKKIVKGLYPKILSIVDTPGFFDSNHKDERNVEDLVSTLRGSGGINAFLLFGADRFDTGHQQILRNLTHILGIEFWKHIIFVRTKVHGQHKEQLEQWKKDFVVRVRHEFDFVHSDRLRIFALDTWYDYKRPIREEFIRMIPKERFSCEAIQSPLHAEIHAELAEKRHQIKKRKDKQKDTERELRSKYEHIELILQKTKPLDEKLYEYHLKSIGYKIRHGSEYLHYDVMQATNEETLHKNIEKSVEVIDYSKKDFATFIAPLIVDAKTQMSLDLISRHCGVSMASINKTIEYLHEKYPYSMINIDHICSLMEGVACIVCDNEDVSHLSEVNDRKYDFYLFLCRHWMEQNQIGIGITACVCVFALIYYCISKRCALRIYPVVNTRRLPLSDDDNEEKVKDTEEIVNNVMDDPMDNDKVLLK